MSKMTVRVHGTRAVIAGLRKPINKYINEGKRRVGLACLHLQRESVKEAPKDLGNLHSSKFIRMMGTPVKPVGWVGYSAVYALAVHENPRSGKTGGKSPSGRPYKHWARRGKWKYLEDPYKREQRKIKQILAGKIP